MKMKRIYIMMILISVSLLLSQSPEEAVDFFYNQEGTGSKAQAMGNAFIGVADDYSAIYWNPAGLTQLSSSEICGDLYHLNFNNEATFRANTVADNKNFTKFKSLGLAYKFPTVQGNLVIALGYNRIKDYDHFLHFSGYNTQSSGFFIPILNEDDEEVEYLFDRNVLQTEKIVQDGNLSNWTLGGGIMLSPNFSVGLTLNIFSGSSQYLFDFYQDDINNYYHLYPADFAGYELHQKIISDFSGWGAKIGGLFQLNRMFKLGVAIDFPTTLNVVENYSENDVLYYDDGYADEVDYGASEWEYDVEYPFQFAAGIAFDLRQLTLAASFEYRDWTQTKFDLPDGYALNDGYNELLEQNNSFADIFRATYNYHLGGEYRLSNSGFKIRGGYSFIPSPFSAAESKLNRQYFSAGFGYDIDMNSTLNASYSRGYWKKESIDDYTPGGTVESIQTSQILAGISYRF
jgi:long-chain fatty acid transport protein